LHQPCGQEVSTQAQPGVSLSIRDIIVIGASSGGVEALRKLVASLPEDLPASVLVVLHIPPESGSMLPEILARSGPLPARHPSDGEKPERGTIYIAPPDHHMLLGAGEIRLDRGPRENGHRPAIDPLFRTAAAAYGPRVIGVILSGGGDDGSAGLQVIKDRGGLAVVQEPADAVFAFMPSAAMLAVDVDASAPAAALAPLIVEMVSDPALSVSSVPHAPISKEEGEIGMVEQAKKDEAEPKSRTGESGPTIITCPDCGGTLFDVSRKNLLRYRCHVGHVFSVQSLNAGQKTVIEEALWNAVRMFEERVVLSSRLLKDAEARGLEAVATGFREQVRRARVSAKLIEELLLEHRRAGKGPARAEGSLD